jgi:hypothetical protein
MPNPGENQSNDGVPEPRHEGSVARKPKGPMIRVGNRIVAHQPGKSVSVGRSQADICIVFDTTGSMSDKIEQLIVCMTGFVDELGSLSLDWRISVVPFGDLTVPGDSVELDWPFVATVDQAKAQLRQMPRFYGGGNIGESSVEAIVGAAGKSWRPGATRVAVLLTDDAALGGPNGIGQVAATLQRSEVIAFVASPEYHYYQEWATRTGGKWFKIGHSMDTGELLTLLRNLVHDVAITAAEIHAIAGGDYKKYLAITSGEERRLNRANKWPLLFDHRIH